MTSLNPDGRHSCIVFNRFVCGVSGSSMRAGIGEEEGEAEVDRIEALLRFRLTPWGLDGDTVGSDVSSDLFRASA